MLESKRQDALRAVWHGADCESSPVCDLGDSARGDAVRIDRDLQANLDPATRVFFAMQALSIEVYPSANTLGRTRTTDIVRISAL